MSKEVIRSHMIEKFQAWGKIFREYRTSRSITMRMLMDQYGITRDMIAAWERGLRSPSHDQWRLPDDWPRPPFFREELVAMRPEFDQIKVKKKLPHLLSERKLNAITSISDPALKILPDRARRLVEMRVLAGLTVRQMADLLEVNHRVYLARERGGSRIKIDHLKTAMCTLQRAGLLVGCILSYDYEPARESNWDNF